MVEVKDERRLAADAAHRGCGPTTANNFPGSKVHVPSHREESACTTQVDAGDNDMADHVPACVVKLHHARHPAASFKDHHHSRYASTTTRLLNNAQLLHGIHILIDTTIDWESSPDTTHATTRPRVGGTRWGRREDKYTDCAYRTLTHNTIVPPRRAGEHYTS